MIEHNKELVEWLDGRPETWDFDWSAHRGASNRNWVNGLALGMHLALMSEPYNTINEGFLKAEFTRLINERLSFTCFKGTYTFKVNGDLFTTVKIETIFTKRKESLK